MFLRFLLNFIIPTFEPLVYDIVRTFAVQPQVPVLPQYHRHPLPHVIKIQDAEQLVDLLHPHDLYGNTVWRPLHEDEPKITGGRHQGRLVGRLRLVIDVAVPVLRHDGVAQRQQPEETEGVGIPPLHGFQQLVVVELELRLEVRVEREVQGFRVLSDLHDIAGALIDDIAKGSAGDGTLIECHDVLGERTGFVGKYVFYLACKTHDWTFVNGFVFSLEK